MKIEDCFPLTFDVAYSYRMNRRMGMGRDAAIAQVLLDCARELEDADDGPQVWIGLARVTASKGELTEKLRDLGCKACDRLAFQYPEMGAVLAREKALISNIDNLGVEAKYPKKRFYHPDWMIGDTFAYQMRGKLARDQGLGDWNVIVRVIDRIETREKDVKYIFYMSICEPDMLPTCKDEVESIGYVPFFRWPQGYLCRGAVTITNPRKEKALHFTKIGSFPDLRPPKEEWLGPEDCSYSMFPDIRSDEFEDLEKYARLGYLKYGVIY